MIAVVDYGAGNLRSIRNACVNLGFKPEIVSKSRRLGEADCIILPGVGSFGEAMARLEVFRRDLSDAVLRGVPFLGLCLGIQVLFEASEESPGVSGLGLLEGCCRRFPEGVKVPHMGWNNVSLVKETPLFDGVEENSLFYFVHSYYVIPKKESVVAGVTDYGLRFPSVVAENNVFATQFHPEKSGESGLTVLRNFLELSR